MYFREGAKQTLMKMYCCEGTLWSMDRHENVYFHESVPNILRKIVYISWRCVTQNVMKMIS